MPRDPGSWFLLTDSAREAARLLPAASPVAIAELTALDETGLSVCWPDGSASRFAMPETTCLGFAALTGARETADGAAAWWAAKSGEALHVYRRTRPLREAEGDSAFTAWLFAALARAGEGLNAANRALFAEASALRRSYAGLQEAFARLEGFVAGSGLSVPILQYDATPVAQFFRPETDGETLMQRLPLLWPRFQRVELFFEPAPEAAAGTLIVTLTLQPQDRVLKRWVLPYDGIGFGALSFAPEAGIDLPSELFATLEWSHAAGAPGVGLSQPQPGDAYVARDGRSLAMRVFSGLDGVRSSAALSGDHPLAFETLARARQHVLAGSIAAGYPSVHADETQKKLIVHPHADVATIAVLAEPLPAGTAAVSALASTFIDRASPLAYAIAAAPDGIPPESLFAPDRLAGDAFSGWHVIPPTLSRRIDLTLKRPADGGVRLYLATRLPPGSTEDYNWAGWSDVVFSGAKSAVTAAATSAPPTPLRPKPLPNGALPFAALAQARRVARDGEAPRVFEPVWSDAADERLIVVPGIAEATIVALDQALPAGPRVVSAIAETTQRDAGIISYAIAALADDDAARGAFSGAGEAGDGFSGWHDLSAGTPLRIAARGRGPAQIYLGVRLAPGANAADAWASWSSVTIAADVAGDV